LLDKGYHVIILTRSNGKKSKPGENVSYAGWDIRTRKIDIDAIAQADYIIHLAGASVAEKRWTKKRKKEIIDSRVESSKLIVENLKLNPNKVKAVISASAIGWYGADPFIPNVAPFEEIHPASDDFLGKTCKLWEESINPLTESGIRLVKLRTGIVLSKEGGALKEFIKPLKFGVATILGNGKQIISWIHIDDLVGMFITAIENEKLSGVYNAVAPAPVSNKELTIQLAKARNKFYIPFYVPSFILIIVLGEMSVEVLKSATVSSKKIQNAGFSFLYPGIDESLKNLIKNSSG